MKKILTAIVLFALVVLPMSVMAMTSITEDELSTVTGQAGVSIGADLSMNLSLGTVAWGDIDGLNAYNNGLNPNHDVGSIEGGWVGIGGAGLVINDLRIHMRTDNGMIDPTVAVALGEQYGFFSAGTYADGAALYAALLAGNVQASKAGLFSILATEQLLTIDIYTAGGTTGLDGKTYVRIGLPTFEINMGDLTLDVGLWTNTTADTPGTYQSLGQVYLGGLDVLLEKNNFVDISQNDTESGVLIHVGNSTGGDLAIVSFTAASWGDLDGLAAYTSGPYADGPAGFIGVRGMDLAIAMDMYVNINVGNATFGGIPGLLTDLAAVTDLAGLATFKATLLGGLAANNKYLKDDLASILHSVGTISSTSVDIALSGTLGISTMATQVVLADNAGLVGSFGGVAGSSAGILGNLYIEGLNVAILGTAAAAGAAPQSWVSISAH